MHFLVDHSLAHGAGPTMNDLTLAQQEAARLPLTTVSGCHLQPFDMALTLPFERPLRIVLATLARRIKANRSLAH
jgi:hypothetical protein